ncbi:MAG: glycosyltransferase [Treponema sp.]|nr:glycosyltransferase [Treponema sp.]
MKDYKYIFTVLLVTYNSDWDKTRQTLYSILSQQEISFEIIIADDGSANNNFDCVKQYFENNNFKDYKLVANSENQGTIKNLLSGLDKAEGKYVKPLSPGDFFYSELSLFNAYKFIYTNEASVYFGRTAYYCIENSNTIIIENTSNPKDINPYKKNDLKKIKRNYFIRMDSIIGASIIYNTGKIKQYLPKLSELAKFAEDYSIYMLLANNEKISYLNIENDNSDYFIWYEANTGISTQKQSKWHEILKIELKAVYKYLENSKLIPKCYYKCTLSDSKSSRFLWHIILDPLFYLKNKIIKDKIKGWNNNKPDIQYLLDILKQK